MRADDTIGRRVRAARLRRRLPLREVAAKADITVSALSQLLTPDLSGQIEFFIGAITPPSF